MLAVLIGWVFFYFTDFSVCLGKLGIMFGGGVLYEPALTVTIKTNLLFIAIAAFASLPVMTNAVRRFFEKFRRDGEASVFELCAGTVFSTASLALCTMLVSGTSYNPFLYFRF